MLLMVEALLLISAALLQDHRAAVLSHPLDMALDSVDDQYIGCSEKMLNLVKTKYLEKEIQKSPDFKKAWEEGEKMAKEPENGLQLIHSVAIHVYTNKDSVIYSDFTKATRTDRQKYTDGSYSWYSLHFLLTEAIQILKKTQNKCFVTYRGTNSKYEVKIEDKSEEVRMSSFSSSSLNQKEAQKFGDVSCFEIYTCEGADVIKYSKYPFQEEVLIPPYETFTITGIKKKEKVKDLWCETVYTLESSGEKSNLNCALFKKKSSI